MISTATPPAAFASQRVVFTGKLASMTRSQAEAVVRAGRGAVTNEVSSRTTLVVVGMQGWPILPDGTIGNKLRQAQELKRRVISEEQFLEMAALRDRKPQLRKAFSAEQVCELLRLDAARLRHWELLGLIRAHDGLYDFQDIVSLRTVASLVAGGVPAHTIASAIAKLAAVLPGAERPLAQLKIVADGPRTLLAEIGDALVDPSGQMRINFDDGNGDGDDRAADDDGVPEPLRLPTPQNTAESLFDQAHEHEVAGRLKEAAVGYRKALGEQSPFPEAHFNLGNVLVQLGQKEAAIEHYRLAVAQAPSFEIAWYNLGYLLDEVGKTAEAVDALSSAVELDPAYTDAHFNLASCLDRLGRNEDALRHWKMFLRLEPVGQAAAHVRSRLERRRG